MNLPEKNYLTFRELARKWNCEESLIYHYVITEKLQPSAFLSGWYDEYSVKYNLDGSFSLFSIFENQIQPNRFKSGIFYLNMKVISQHNKFCFRYFSSKKVVEESDVIYLLDDSLDFQILDGNQIYVSDKVFFVEDEIRRFEKEHKVTNEDDKISQSQGIVENGKPLGNRERNNLLKVIAALCKEQNLSLDMPYKAATIVENQIKSIGHSLGSDTIASILDEAGKITKAAKKS